MRKESDLFVTNQMESYHTRMMWIAFFSLFLSPTIIIPSTIKYILLALKESRHKSSSSAGVHIYPSEGMCFLIEAEKCLTDKTLNTSLLGQQLFMGYSAQTVKHR